MISVEHLRKCYGDVVAVDDLSFTIDDGHVYGFLGPNGAGKSTTMNIMTGCLSATDGKVIIDGHDIYEEADAAKRLIGYLPEQPPLYLSDKVEEYLSFIAEAKGLRGDDIERQVNDVIEITKLDDYRHRRIAELSKGYKQRVGIAQCLLADPKVIILDEPTVGLDPIQIIEIRELIKELGKDRTVIFSSHILSEVQAISDEILIINKGKLVAFDKPEDLERHLLEKAEIKIKTDARKEDIEAMLSDIREIKEIVTLEGSTDVAIRSDIDDIYVLSKKIYEHFKKTKYIIYEMTIKKATLEDVFLELTEQKEGAL